MQSTESTVLWTRRRSVGASTISMAGAAGFCLALSGRYWTRRDLALCSPKKSGSGFREGPDYIEPKVLSGVTNRKMPSSDINYRQVNLAPESGPESHRLTFLDSP